MKLVDLFYERNGRYPKGNVQDELRAWCESYILHLERRLNVKEQASYISELKAAMPGALVNRQLNTEETEAEKLWADFIEARDVYRISMRMTPLSNGEGK